MIVGPLSFLSDDPKNENTQNIELAIYFSFFFPFLSFFLSFFFYFVLRNGHEFAECLKSCASILLTKWAATSYVGPYEALQHCGPDVCKAENEDESPT